MFRSSLPNRRDSIRRSSQQDYTIIECALQHFHWQCPSSKNDFNRPAMIEWMSRIERQLPLSMLASEAGTARMAPVGKDASEMVVSPRGGYVLLRVGKVKMMNWEEKSYQLIVQLGPQVLASCPANRITGLQDYFLLNIRGFREIKATDRIEISICPVGHTIAEKMRLLKHAASGLLKIGRANAKVPALEEEEEADPLVSIPLSHLVSHEASTLTACYYVLASERPGPTIVGEIALQLVAFPETFVLHVPGSPKAPLAQPLILHQQYLTIPSGKHHWKRVFALLHEHSIYLHDFQRHAVSHGAPINLKSMVDIKFVPRHVCGLENVVSMKFEDEPELLVYADNEEEGLGWTNAVCRAIWNQPYSA